MKTLPKGHLSVLDRRFKYTPSGSTDLRATFERIRSELERAARAKAEAAARMNSHQPIQLTRKGRA